MTETHPKTRYISGITWLTSFSLDAPIVAIVWQHTVSTSFSLQIDWYHRVLVFLSVWLGYSADRWFDAWRHKENITQRHRFVSRYRWPLLGIWITTLIGSMTLALASLDARELAFGIALTLSSITITLVVQFITFTHFRSLIKSLLTASLVSASVLLFAFPENVHERISAASLLLAIFTLNCSFIHNWDRSIDAIQEKPLNDSTQIESLKIAFAWVTIALIAFRDNPLFPYTLASTILLIAIHMLRNRIHPETRRTLADLSLLTPLAVLI